MQNTPNIPPTSILPPSGRAKVVKQAKVVVFPAHPSVSFGDIVNVVIEDFTSATLLGKLIKN